jgi:hypothetical protein
MATLTKFYCFSLDLSSKKHNLASDQLQVALTDTAHAPVVTNTVLANLTQVSYTNLSAQTITTTSCNQASGTTTLILADLVLTASGAVGPFQYVVIFNQTATNDELIGFYDYGSAVTLANGETFTIDFSAGNGFLQIT